VVWLGGGLVGCWVCSLVVWLVDVLTGGLVGWWIIWLVLVLVGWSVTRLITHKFGSVKVTTQSHPVHKLRISDSVPQLPSLSPRHAQGQLHLHGS
jgi:hypothetical protein